MNLKYLSNQSLLSQTKLCVQKEREMTLQVLHHLREVERRRLFASLSYSSLFEYVTRELGYCAASACRRIDAMRLLKELPEIEERIQEGALTLSTVARAQSFFKKETTRPTSLSVEQKSNLMKQLENKSIRQVEKELIALASSPEAHLQEKIRAVTPTLSELKFYANDELLENLEKLKGLLAHSHPNMTTSELISYLAQLGLKKLDPAQQEVKTRSTPAPNESMRQNRSTNHVHTKQPSSRYVPRPILRAVWKRDQSQCTWVDAKTGKQCSSTYRLQLDHRYPFALGGQSTEQNLRLLCFQHNQYEAERFFGPRLGLLKVDRGH